MYRWYWLQDLLGRIVLQQKRQHYKHSPKVLRGKAKVCRLRKQHTGSEKDHNLEEFLAKEYILPSIGLRNSYVVHFSPVRQSRAPVSQVQNGQAHFKRFQIAKRSVTYIL